jgi:hypothetical protein
MLKSFSAHIGLSNWCNFSTLTQGRPFYSQENDKQCQLSHGHLQNEQPSLRLVYVFVVGIKVASNHFVL